MLEESFEQLDQEQCAAYLKRLKLPQEECTLEFLDRLIRRHLEEIPFENLDLVRTHELISTDLDLSLIHIWKAFYGIYANRSV